MCPVQLLEHGLIAVRLGEAQRFDPLDQDFAARGLAAFDQADHLGGEVGEGHVGGVVRMARHQVGGHAGRRQFQHLDAGVAQLMTQRLGP